MRHGRGLVPSSPHEICVEHGEKPTFGSGPKENGWGDSMMHPPPDAGVWKGQFNKKNCRKTSNLVKFLVNIIDRNSNKNRCIFIITLLVVFLIIV